MTFTLLQAIAWLRARLGALSLAAMALSAGGCATLAPFDGHLASPVPQLRECAEWFSALDAAVDGAGVRDAGATRIAGFPYLRVDRFSAALRADAARSEGALHALADRLWQLDFDARRHEIANLPEAARTELGKRTGEPEMTRLATRTRECGRLLREIDLAKPGQRAALLGRLAVPDDYVTGYPLLLRRAQVPGGDTRRVRCRPRCRPQGDAGALLAARPPQALRAANRSHGAGLARRPAVGAAALGERP